MTLNTSNMLCIMSCLSLSNISLKVNIAFWHHMGWRQPQCPRSNLAKHPLCDIATVVWCPPSWKMANIWNINVIDHYKPMTLDTQKLVIVESVLNLISYCVFPIGIPFVKWIQNKLIQQYFYMALRQTLETSIHFFHHRPAICRQWQKLTNWVETRLATPQFSHDRYCFTWESSRNMNKMPFTYGIIVMSLGALES